MTATNTQTGLEVKAAVNYIRNPRASASEPKLEFVTEDESLSTMQTLPGEVMTIRSARGLATSLDREGFILVPHVSKVRDFGLIEEDPEVDQLYIDEMATLTVRQKTCSDASGPQPAVNSRRMRAGRCITCGGP